MGGIAGGMKSQGGTTNTAPWAQQKPYLLDLFKRSKEATDKPMQYFPGQAVAGFNPLQSQAQDETLARANAGSPLNRTAQDVTLATARGNYLSPDSNPYLRATYQQAYNDARPSYLANAVRAGRVGSTGTQVADAALKDRLATGIYGGNYQTERGRQMDAVNAAPGMANLDYTDIGRKAAVGDERRSMEQALIDAAMQKHDFEQTEAINRLGAYQGLIHGNYGGTTSGSSRASNIGGSIGGK